MDINARLEKLERENRRMKKIGIVAVVFASVLFISGQAKTSKVVEANEFRLLDDSGKVRAKLAMVPLYKGPELSFYNAEGQSRISIFASEDEARIDLDSSRQGTVIPVSTSMWAGSSGTRGLGFGIIAPAGYFRVNLDGPIFTGPQLSLEDKEGYRLEIGRSDLVDTKTGRKEQTPAASVVLFNKDNKVLWSAP